jgi:hypothetical protein
VVYRNTSDTTPIDVQVTLDLFCGQGAGTVAEPCGTDPAVAALLTQIYQLLQLVQRQHVPFAHVAAGEDAGLTGQGQLDVQGLLAVTVLLTTMPPYLGLAEGDPDRLFDVGWITAGTADGWLEPRRITTSPFMLRLGGDVTKIGYSLNPGVVATIRRHQREP